MDERYWNYPFNVTREAAIGYALYFGLYSPHVGYGVGAMWTFAVGGAAMLCIVAAIEVRMVRRRQRNSTDQTIKPPAPNPGAGQDSN